MKTIDDRKQNKHRDKILRTLLWILQITVALQCLGNWRWFTQIQETPLLHWLLDPSDIGGLGWSESTALATQQTVGWLVLLAGGLVLWRPLPLVLAAIGLLQTLIAVAMWQTADGYALQSQWLPPQLLALFPLATQAGRIVAPLGLLLLATSRMQGAIALLRWAIAVVFLAHGLEAWLHNPIFLDLLISSSQRLLGWSMSQSMAERVLTAIGALDILLAVACVSLRSSTLLGWMALWGAVTAFSRIAAYGWALSWHETFTRISHLAIPLAVALGWHLLKYERLTEEPRKTTS